MVSITYGYLRSSQGAAETTASGDESTSGSQEMNEALQTVETVEKVIRVTLPSPKMDEFVPPKRGPFFRDFIFQASILGGYVSFQGGGRPFVAEMEMILKIYVNFEGPCWFEGGYLMTSGHRQIIWYSWKNILGVDRSRGSKWRFTMENFQSLHIHQRFATLYSFCWENCFSFWQRAWCKSTFWWTTNVMCHYWSKVQIGLLLAPQKKTQTQSHEGFWSWFCFEGNLSAC